MSQYLSNVLRKNFSLALQRLREERKLTQWALDDLLGVPRGTVNNWELCRSMPGPKNQAKFRAVLGGTPEDLITRYVLATVNTETASDMLRDEPVRRDDFAEAIRGYVDRLITTYQDNPARLGWLLEEIRRRYPLANAGQTGPLSVADLERLSTAELEARLTPAEVAGVDRQARAIVRSLLVEILAEPAGHPSAVDPPPPPTAAPREPSERAPGHVKTKPKVHVPYYPSD